MVRKHEGLMTEKATDKIKKVVIAGAGVGGLTAAVALHRRGIDVEVYEKHEAAAKHTTGFTLWSYAIARLAALGVGPKEMEGIGSTVEVTEIRNQKGRLISEMPVGEVSRKLGHESYEIRRPRLLEALEACLPAGTVRRGAECV
jgi:2-polyprenyl-6-methoxyphenol hydroxylase-like FAD-dependent oxidoreductase